MHSTRIFTHGWAVVCLLATAANVNAQEQTAGYKAPAGATQTVTQMNHTPMHFHNEYAYYPPGNYTYPNYPEPNRGYVYFGYTGRECCRPRCRWLDGFRDWRTESAARRANFGARFRCSMGFLRPLTYWDFGAQKDVIALDPNYAHPNDMGTNYYAAQGYGVPVSVPLPPSVRASYNYGWGLPSSRITPVTSPAGY